MEYATCENIEKARYATVAGDSAQQVRPFDRCIEEANAIREQIAEAAKVADAILNRLIGPRPEGDCGQDPKAIDAGGVIGELSRIQGSSVGYLADLRRTLEQIGRHI